MKVEHVLNGIAAVGIAGVFGYILLSKAAQDYYIPESVNVMDFNGDNRPDIHVGKIGVYDFIFLQQEDGTYVREDMLEKELLEQEHLTKESIETKLK